MTRLPWRRKRQPKTSQMTLRVYQVKAVSPIEQPPRERLTIRVYQR